MHCISSALHIISQNQHMMNLISLARSRPHVQLSTNYYSGAPVFVKRRARPKPSALSFYKIRFLVGSYSRRLLSHDTINHTIARYDVTQLLLVSKEGQTEEHSWWFIIGVCSAMSSDLQRQQCNHVRLAESVVLHTPGSAVGGNLFVAAVDMHRAVEGSLAAEEDSPAVGMPAAVVGTLAAAVVDILAAQGSQAAAVAAVKWHSNRANMIKESDPNPGVKRVESSVMSNSPLVYKNHGLVVLEWQCANGSISETVSRSSGGVGSYTLIHITRLMIND